MARQAAPPACPVISQAVIDERIADRRMRIVGGILEKFCPRCHQWLPADNQFFPLRPALRDGLDSWCSCCNTESRHRVPAPIAQLEAIAA